MIKGRSDNYQSDGDVEAASVTVLSDIKENVVIVTGLLENISRRVKTVSEWMKFCRREEQQEMKFSL